jgi:two-component system, chemotaxis family, CheB/CheR fusion protein
VTHTTAPYVVGIGASAGGLEALEAFFDALPKDTGMAFVVVQHLSPDFKSLMDELLARHTELPIHLVEDAMPIEPNHVYLIPAKKEMIIAGGRLLLSERDRQQELTLPIDVFFRSLAQDCRSRAIAIVLSGSGSDGSRGIRDVHEAGGLVLVQDVDSAQFDGMPRAARDAGVADFILSPSEMPQILVEHASAAAKSELGAVAKPAPQGLAAVYAILAEAFGLDFTHYKPSTVTRRIERRLKLARADDIDAYVERLGLERGELDTLYRDLLIGVTRFFRNEEAFEILEHKVLPELFRRGPSDVPLRVWVAGCATGEEAYSLAIVLSEASERCGGRPVKIFATDVHRGSLEIAGRGFYDEEALANVSPERRDRWFVRAGRGYQVAADLRQMVVFAQHNVIKDAPFTRVDLVTCRNLLIYLQPSAQQKVLSLFHFALNRGGVVFLGPSESPGALLGDFETIDRHWRLYRKYTDVRIRVDAHPQRSRGVDVRMPAAALSSGQNRYSLPTLLGTYDTLLDEFMPPGLLLTERGELVHSFAGASRFLRLRDGRQALDVLDVVDTELKMVLVGGLQRAKREGAPIVFRGVRISDSSGKDAPYKVTIRTVRSRSGGAGHLLVSFEELETAEQTPDAGREIALEELSRDQVNALEVELGYTKENLQAAIEELETSNEELQAANEELLASNEELQSTNEELQSVNEELYTVNAEYQRKIGELTELTNDMDNLLSSTEIGTIFLDRELRIRKFTPTIAETFRLLPQDIGRPIETFTHSIDHVGLGSDLRSVAEAGVTIERELRDRQGRAYFMRILPYRAKGAVAGVVLTLVDVTGLKDAENALFHERYLLNSLLASSRDAIYFKDARGRFIRMNPPMAARLGVADPETAHGKTAFDLPDQNVALALHHQDDAVLRTGRAEHDRLERRERDDGEEAWDMATRLPLVDASSSTVGMIGILRDVTAQRRAEEKIREAVRRRDEFLAMLSHELRNPLGAVVTATALLKEEHAKPEARSKFLQIVDRQSQQMTRLLDDLLEASRVTQNKIELRKRSVDLGAVARDAADAVRSLMRSRDIRFSASTPSSPLHVVGDPVRIQQIIANLLTNAAKYTDHGGEVSLDVSANGGEAVIRVRDDGVGIRADILDSIFDLFVQSRRTLDRADGGLGVGLTLVKSLVAMHDGTVSAASDGEGRGSEFVVRLPLDDTRREEAALPDPRLRVPPGAKIAVIEDNADSREMLCALLELAGFECHSASSGDEGLRLIQERRPDVGLVDIGLPGLDGFELARQVRQDPRSKAMILLAISGYGQPADREKATQAGFDAHVVKPVEPRALLRMLGHTQPPRRDEASGGQTHDGLRSIDGVIRVEHVRSGDGAAGTKSGIRALDGAPPLPVEKVAGGDSDNDPTAR